MLEEEKKQTKEKEDIDIPRLLSAQEVGEMLGISERAVKKLVSEGRLGYVRLTGNRRVFTMELVAEFVEGETVRRDPDRNDHNGGRSSPTHQMNPYDRPTLGTYPPPAGAFYPPGWPGSRDY